MIHQSLLRRAVAQRHPALQAFVETLAPTLLLRFSGLPALGGAADVTFEDDTPLPPEAVPLDQRAREAFARGHDQSLSAHLFNGIFAGARMAEELPADQQLRDEEWRVWILGFVVHDYTKSRQINIRAEHIPAIRTIISQEGERLGFDDFFPTWREYLDDIVFIAQNTQTRRGANLDMHLYPNLRLRPRRLERMRMLASFADVLVHILHPADVAERDSRGRDRAQNLRTKLGLLFDMGQAPRLAYHQLTEVRGLLSNLINNALMRALEAQGYQPYLFFPDGVVYIVTGGQRATLDGDALIDALWAELGETLSGGETDDVMGTDEDEAAGEEQVDVDSAGGLKIRRSSSGKCLTVPPVLYELLSFEQLLTAARFAALKIKSAKTAARLGSEVADDQSIRVSGSTNEKQNQYASIGAAFARENELPTDVRVDQVAEFCAFMYQRLKTLFPKSEWLPMLLPNALNLQDTVPADRIYRNKGGVPTGWFFAAAHYLKANPHLDEFDIETVLVNLQKHVVNFLRAQAPQARVSGGEAAWADAYQRMIDSKGGKGEQRGRFEATFHEYARSVITLDGERLIMNSDIIALFRQELLNYVERKEDNTVVCSMCSSPYDAKEQAVSEVLFAPQQYSNKNRLDTRIVKRGICPICALEMMLRRVSQNVVKGSKYQEDEKPVTLYLYPTYFFTIETAEVIHEFIGRLRDLSLPDLIFRHLGRNGFTLQALASYTEFMADNADDTIRHNYTLNKPAFSARDPASLFFFTMRPAMSKPTDTDAWIVPALYALLLPLVLDIKVVVSSSFVPLYNSGADFRGTSVLDAPHNFTRYLLDREHLRVNEIEPVLWRLLRLYELHLDVFMEPKDLHWGLLNTVAKDVATDPLYVFSYYDRKQRKPKAEGAKSGKAKAKKSAGDEASGDGIPPFTVARYMAIYDTLKKEDPMSFIKAVVDGYAAFYRADNLKAAYAVLRPLATAMDVTVESDPKTCSDDLLLLVAGALNDDQERVRSGQADGFDPIATNKNNGTYPERLALSRQKIEDFAQIFLGKVFVEYCNGDRGILRERANRIRSAARFYYLSRYARRDQVTEDTDEE